MQTSQQKLVTLTVNSLPETQVNVFETQRYVEVNEEVPLGQFQLYSQLNCNRNASAAFQYLNKQSPRANVFLDGENLGLKLSKVVLDSNGVVSVLDLSNQGKRTSMLQKKQIQGQLINFYDGILVFYVGESGHVIEVVSQVLSYADFNSEKAKQFLLKHWLGHTFRVNLKGVVQVILNSQPRKVLRAEVSEGGAHDKFYEDLVAHGFAKVSDYAKVALPENEIRLLLQYQEVAINQQNGIWKFGKLDRKKLNEKSNQTIGTIVEVVEPNLFVIEKKEGDYIQIQLDRVFVEGNEAKDFVVKLAIGKKVQIIQIKRSYQL